MIKTKRSPQSPSHGFTIVELLIIAPIVILTIGTFITVIVNMTGEVLATRSSNVLAYSIQDALDRIESDVKLSTTFLAVNNVALPVASHQGYDDNTANFANVDNGTKGNMLILNTLATTGNPLSSTNGLVYLKLPNLNDCLSPQINQNTPMTMNVIYFVKTVGGTSSLWRRSVMTSDYASAGCAVPWQQPSCAPGVTDAFCKTQDVRLVDGINPSDFVVQYFNTADATAANSVAGDNGQSPALRSAALQSTATIGVSINVTKTAAGRTINQTGTMRATRLDINASTIAAIVPAVIPASPVVTGSFLTPDSGQFSWPAVPGASSYTIEKQIDSVSGPWTVVASNITATTYNISALRLNAINARVTAISSAGSSAVSNTATVTIPAWNALVLQNNWSDYNQGYAASAYTKTSAGVVVLKGLIKRSGTPTAYETIGVLPPGYRPASIAIFQTSTDLNVASRVDVYPDGSIRYVVGSAAWFALDGIKFLPTGSPYPFTPLTLSGAWVNYDSGVHETAGYAVDGSGRVQLKGLVKNGTGTIGVLPVGYQPPQIMYLPGDATNAFGDFSIDTAGAILPHAYTNPYFSIQSMFYPASYAWPNTLTLLNGWVAYGGGLSTPQFTKAADGIVTVKGFIKSGTITSGTVIANLPAGYRPKETILLGGAAWDAYSRIDIQTNGDIVARVVSAGWTSLDAITFMAEQ